MATAPILGTSPAPLLVTSVEGDQCVVLRAVGWAGYRALLRLRGEKSVPRMTYLDGDLWLMSPSFSHERLAERLGLFVMVVVEELDIPCTPAGHTTFRRKKKRGGVEGDKTFYLANEGRIRGKENIDLRFDPPPDLAIEAVYTHGAAPAVEVWRRFRVPEIWACDEDRLRILAIGADGRYAESGMSIAFPFLTATEVFEWVSRPQTCSETDWIKDVRRWVRKVLVRRVGGQGD